MGIVDTLRGWIDELAEAEDKPKCLRGIVDECAAIEAEAFINELRASYDADDVNVAAALISGPLNYLMAQNDEPESFYRRLWSFVETNELIAGDAINQIVLGIIATHIGMPYRKAAVVTMSDEEYASRVQKLAPVTKDLIGMARRHFPQKTQGAAAVLDIVNSQEDERDRAVLMVALIEFEQSRMLAGMPA